MAMSGTVLGGTTCPKPNAELDTFGELHAFLVTLICTFMLYFIAVYISTEFGAGVGPIFFRDVDCDGTEASISLCDSSSIATYHCSHIVDAGMKCENTQYSGLHWHNLDCIFNRALMLSVYKNRHIA